MAWRMLVSPIVSLAASCYVAGRLGQPVLLGMVAGGVLGLISSFMVGDVPVAQVAARVGWHVVRRGRRGCLHHRPGAAVLA
jgi:hypothetical protein